MGLHHRRDFALVERDLARHRARYPHLFPRLEQTPDVNRGQQRFAAEVALAELAGRAVPSFAHERAVEALTIIAKG